MSKTIQEQWANHRENFKALKIGESKTIHHGVIVIDGTSSIPRATVLLYLKPDLIRSWSLMFDSQSDALNATVNDIVSGIINQQEHEEKTNICSIKQIPISKAFQQIGMNKEGDLARESVDIFLNNIENTENIKKDVLISLEQKRISAFGGDEFSKLLKDETRNLLSALDYYDWGTYRFYDSKNENRIQAASIYPVFAGLFSKKPNCRVAIDEGQSINKVLISGFGIPKSILKRIKNIKCGGNLEIEHAITALSDIQPDWVPETEEDWKSFCDISATIGVLLRDVMQTSSHQLYSGCGGKWEDFMSRLMTAYELPEITRESLRVACRDTEEMIISFANSVIIPMASNITNEDDVFVTNTHKDIATKIASTVLFGEKGCVNIFESSRHWQTQAHNILSSVKVSENEWPSLTETVQAPNGLWLVPLVKSKQLEDEGCKGKDSNGNEGLNHCIATYVSACFKRGTHIISVRDGIEGKFERFSTFEIAPPKESNHLEIVQQNGSRNHTPAKEARDAADWYVNQIGNDKIDINRQDISDHLNKINSSKDPVYNLCQYNWREYDKIETAFKLWTGYITGKYKNQESLLGMEEINELAEEMSSGYVHKM